MASRCAEPSILWPMNWAWARWWPEGGDRRGGRGLGVLIQGTAGGVRERRRRGGRFLQGVVARAQRQAEPQGQLKVGRVVGGQPVATGEAEDRVEGQARGLRVDRDRQSGEEAEPFGGLGLGGSLAALAHEQHVGDFQRPEGGHSGPLGCQRRGHGIGEGSSLVLEIPGHRDRAIDDEGFAAIQCLRVRPPSLPPPLVDEVADGETAAERRALLVLNAVMAASVAVTSGRGVLSVAGTSRATGLPWRVMVIVSPCSTRSRSWGR